MPDINDKFRAFVEANKPIILGCVDRYGESLGVMDKVNDYQVLKTLNKGECAIFVPKESAIDSAIDSAKSAESSKNQKGVKK